MTGLRAGVERPTALSATQQVFLRLARLAPSAADRAVVAELTSKIAWDELDTLTHRAGLAGIVLRQIEALTLPAPAAVRRHLASLALLGELQTRVQLEEAVRLCAAAEAGGLTLVPLKGAALILGGPYRDDPALRPMADVDVLARREQMRAIEALLRREGYRDYGERENLLRWWHHTSFIRRRGSVDVVVELHWTALRVMHSRAEIDGEILARTRHAELGGRRLRLLDLEATLLSVGFHVAAHRYREQLKWLVDVAELLRGAQGLDAAALWRLAGAVGGTAALARVFVLAHELLDAPLPAGTPAPRRLLAALSPAAEAVSSPPQPSLARRLAVNLLQYDSPLDALGYAVHKGAEIVERLSGVPVPRLLARRAVRHRR